MGKGYNNYMCKKPFHPGSKANIKRTWMAEQKTENEKRKQDDLKLQYEKEQDLYNNKALLSKESKDKLGLNFMYEAPPGAKKERQKEDDEPEYKFEWQRKYNAPREEFAKDNKDIRDQPFGIQVRNVRCIKCHKWGHINTDKECPLYNKASNTEISGPGMDPLDLMRRMMEEDGLALKQNVLGRHIAGDRSNQELIPSDDEDDIEAEFLKTLTTKQKKKLLRKLEKLEKSKKKHSKKKKDSKKKKKKHHKTSDSGSKSRKSKSRKRRESSSSSSDSSSSTLSSSDSEMSQSKRKRDSLENDRSESEKQTSNTNKDHYGHDDHYSKGNNKRAKKEKDRVDSNDDERHRDTERQRKHSEKEKYYKEERRKFSHSHDSDRYKDSRQERHKHADNRH